MLCDVLQNRINKDGGQHEEEDEMKDLKTRWRIEAQWREKRGQTEGTRGDDDDEEEEEEEEDEDASLSLPLPEL